MTVGILITARLGSSRLKRKHLLPVKNRTLLEYLLARIRTEFALELTTGQVRIVIVTSDEPENRDFEPYASDSVQVFYGSRENIPLRHLQAAHALELAYLVAVDGDDILCSTRGMRRVLNGLQDGHAFVKTHGLPFGMNVMGYSTAFLEESVGLHRHQCLETGWGRIFDVARQMTVPFTTPSEHPLLRFTLDYPADYAFFKGVIESFGSEIDQATDEEIVALVQENQLYQLNQDVSEEYWHNFSQGVAMEEKAP